jgi:DNA-binding MarR family transcriptional regulator
MSPNVPPASRARPVRATRAARAARVSSAVDSLRRIVRALRVSAQRTHTATGATAAQLFVLRQLVERRAESLSELGERTLTDRSSVADVVDRLAERGLVRRETSAQDRRRVAIEITPAGRELLAEAPEPPTALLIEGLQRLDRPALDALADGLEQLVTSMGIESEPAMMLFEDRRG